MADLLKLTWADFEAFEPCYTENGGSIPEWGHGSGTMLDILRNPKIPTDDKLWAFTCGHLMTGDAAIDDRILRLFACKCVRETPIGDGIVVWDLLTDEHSRNAVEVAERFAMGEATQEELNAAWSAALAAARDAAMAARAARAAASDALAAARDARAAAWDALAAAWDALAAARDARAAAWDAAMAARDAAMAAQVQFAIEIIEVEVQP
jgi:hypothetical protein